METLGVFSLHKINEEGGGTLAVEGFVQAFFIHAGGTLMEKTLAPGETLRVDTGCVVAFQPSVDFDIQYAGKIKTALFGGEGLFFAKMTGPGTLWLQKASSWHDLGALWRWSDLWKRLDDLLADEAAMRDELLSADGVRELLRRHLDGKGYHQSIFSRVLSFLEWRRSCP